MGAKKRYSKPKVGDVFDVPAPDGRRGIGQVVRAGGVPYVIILRDLFEDRPPPVELVAKEILLAAWTTDALFFHGRWVVVGNCPVVEDRIPYPSYLVLINGELVVEDFNGASRRLATPDDLRLLHYRTTYSPITLQKALLAQNG